MTKHDAHIIAMNWLHWQLYVNDQILDMSDIEDDCDRVLIRKAICEIRDRLMGPDDIFLHGSTLDKMVSELKKIRNGTSE